MSSKPILAYWDIRGLVEPIRNLLHYLNVDFEDKCYPIGPNNDRSSWTNEKFNLGLDFPNLPYYIDGDTKLTQSLTILRYIARKYKLDGVDDAQYAKISLLEQQLQDNRMMVSRIAYDPVAFANQKETYVKEQLPASVELLSKFLGANQYAVGGNITYVDFLLYEYTVILKVLAPEVFAKFDNLKQYLARIEALPQLQTYLKSRKPKNINGFTASWNAEY